MDLNEAQQQLHKVKGVLGAIVTAEEIITTALDAQSRLPALEKKRTDLETFIGDIQTKRNELVDRLEQERTTVDRELDDLKAKVVKARSDHATLVEDLDRQIEGLKTTQTDLAARIAKARDSALKEKEDALRAQEVEHQGRLALMADEEHTLLQRVESARRQLAAVRAEVGAP